MASKDNCNKKEQCEVLEDGRLHANMTDSKANNKVMTVDGNKFKGADDPDSNEVENNLIDKDDGNNYL